MKNRETKLSQLEHSQAKVELYTKYLAVYLNVLHRVSSIKHINIHDLLCGEGKYLNDCLGSSVSAAKVIKDHYFSNGKTCTDTTLFLNDAGQSEIEPNKSKIQRNRELIEAIYLPDNVTVVYEELDYSNIIQATISRLDSMTASQRALVFLDPYGYKKIDTADLAALLRNHKTELLLFLPASFIYRIAESVMQKEFPGSEPAKILLLSVFGSTLPCFTSCDDFIEKFRLALQAIVQTTYSSSFIIERDASNTYCLLFFTNNDRGFEKMLETKWALDDNRGHGFRLNANQTSMFNVGVLDNFDGKVYAFISSAQNKNNRELKMFGLQCGYLPKHTLEILKSLKADNKIEAIDESGKPARSFYLADKDRVIIIRRKG